jgi:hypothetical protein
MEEHGGCDGGERLQQGHKLGRARRASGRIGRRRAVLRDGDVMELDAAEGILAPAVDARLADVLRGRCVAHR